MDFGINTALEVVIRDMEERMLRDGTKREKFAARTVQLQRELEIKYDDIVAATAVTVKAISLAESMDKNSTLTPIELNVLRRAAQILEALDGTGN